jgi:MYXO-CTERM domain-containing protein
MLRPVLSALVVAGIAGSANAAYFSFASDNDHRSWTFAGNGANVRDANDATDPQLLLIDDNNGVLPSLPFDVEFDANFTIGFSGSVPLGNGAFVHNYVLNGTFTFTAAGLPLLSATVSNGALTAIGTQTQWFSTATLQGSDYPGNPGGAVTYTWSGPAAPGYGLFPGQSIGPDDMAFTLSVINSSLPRGVSLGDNMLPSGAWTAEGSYSGSSNFVPAPGALALLGVGGLMVSRRRR